MYLRSRIVCSPSTSVWFIPDGGEDTFDVNPAFARSSCSSIDLFTFQPLPIRIKSASAEAALTAH